MSKYFLISASKDHVLTAVKAGIAQAGHGRKDYISRLSKGDWIVYYSSKETFENGKLLQRFTALGKVIDNEPCQVEDGENFKPFRRKVKFNNSHEADIHPLLENLSFIKNKKKWGFYLISGFREILKDDFEIIQKAMK